MELLGGLGTKGLPTQDTQRAIQEHDGTLTAPVVGFGQRQSPRLTNAAGQPTTMQNTGFMTALPFDNQTAPLAPSSGTPWADPDRLRQFETTSGIVATCSWRMS